MEEGKMATEQVEMVNGIPCKVTQERFLGGYRYVYTFTVPGWDECSVIGRRAAKRVINGRCDPAVRNTMEKRW
jgi:hypothetical protein